MHGAGGKEGGQLENTRLIALNVDVQRINAQSFARPLQRAVRGNGQQCTDISAPPLSLRAPFTAIPCAVAESSWSR
jgi:hypothetical protein